MHLLVYHRCIRRTTEEFQFPAVVSGADAECRQCGTIGEFKGVAAGTE